LFWSSSLAGSATNQSILTLCKFGRLCACTKDQCTDTTTTQTFFASSPTRVAVCDLIACDCDPVIGVTSVCFGWRSGDWVWPFEQQHQHQQQSRCCFAPSRDIHALKVIHLWRCHIYFAISFCQSSPVFHATFYTSQNINDNIYECGFQSN
jgi:hypothetical protein